MAWPGGAGAPLQQQGPPPVPPPPPPPQQQQQQHQQEQAGAGAGGGSYYPAVPAAEAAPTPASPEESAAAKARREQYYPAGPEEVGPPFQGPQPPPPPGYPGTYASEPQPPATVLGIPIGGLTSQINSLGIWGPENDQQQRLDRFRIAGWALFALGFLFPFFWLIAVLLPCCLPGRSVRHAALASSLAALLYIILAVVLGPTMGMRMRGGRGSSRCRDSWYHDGRYCDRRGY